MLLSHSQHPSGARVPHTLQPDKIRCLLSNTLFYTRGCNIVCYSWLYHGRKGRGGGSDRVVCADMVVL